jgi:hypothetical protein
VARPAKRKDTYRPRSSPHGIPPRRAVAGIIGLLALTGAGFWFAFQQVRGDAIDEATLCPVGGATGSLAILLDMTDPLGATQSIVLQSKLNDLVLDSPRGTLVGLGRVSDQPGDLGAAFVACRPMTGAEGGDVTRNSRMLEERFQERFLTPFRKDVSSLLDAKEASSSPIMEALQALLGGMRAVPSKDGGPHRVVIVSDLLQHSDAMSFYRGEDWNSFRASPSYSRLAHTLAGADVSLIRVPRPGARVDAAAVDDFWVRYLEAQEAERVDVETLGDL